MNKKILFLVEGESMEACNVDSIASKMFHLLDQEYEIISYNTTIYELYRTLKDDPNLGIIGLLKEQNKIKLEPGVLCKQAFSQIYLIFDFEPHYQKYSDEAILEMQEYFDDETDNGKLYINYPMFEATFYIDDFNAPNTTFNPISIKDCPGKVFKKMVRTISCFGNDNHLDFKLLKKTDIFQSIKWNYIKATRLIQKNELDYLEILKKQIETKNLEHTIIVLSTFILMIVDYNPRILDVVDDALGLFSMQ